MLKVLSAASLLSPVLLATTGLVAGSVQGTDGDLLSIEPVEARPDSELLAHPSLSRTDLLDKVQINGIT